MKRIILLFITLLSLQANGQVNMDIHKLIAYADSAINRGVSELMIPGAVMGIATSDSILLLKGYGYGDIKRKVRVDPNTTRFQVGSVGKIFTSIALIQQVDAGKITLNDDVNDFLDGWKLDNAFANEVTPFHLLTHTAGLNDQFIGYMAKSNEDVEPLGKHLAKHMPGLFQPPGTEINYSNYGYALAGHLVERVTGNDFKSQVSAQIFEPLDMTTASYFLPDDYLNNMDYANGYLLRDTFVEARMYPRHAIPAGSVVASGQDMITFAQIFLRRDSSILSQEGYDMLLTQQFSNHPGLSGYTLGMEVQNINGHLAYAKAGQVTGFLSLIMIFPDLDLTIFISSNTETDNFLEDFFKGFKENFFPIREVSMDPVPFDPGEYAGNYANERCNHDNLEELFALFAGHFQIYESDSGGITAYHNGEWNEYRHMRNDVFYHKVNPDIKMVFKRNDKGKLTSLYRSVNVAGIDIPASYRKLDWTERPRFINDEYPFALTFLLTYLLMPIFWVVTFFAKNNRIKPSTFNKVDNYFHIPAMAFTGLFIWNVFGFFIPLLQLREKIAFGLPDSLLNFTYFNWVMAFCAFTMIIFAIKIWVNKKGRVWFRIYYTLFGLVACSYVLLLNHWHMLTVKI